MLDERVTKFVHDAVRIKAREFDQDLALRLQSIDTEYAKAGQFQGTARIVSYGQCLTREIRNRAHYVFIEIQRALTLHQLTFDDTTKSYLIGLLITEVRGQTTHLQRMLQERFGNAGDPLARALGIAQTQMNDECEHLNEKFTLEMGVRQIAAQAAADRRTTGNGGIIVHGSVGVLQTGASASATLMLNVGSDDRQAMLKALDLVTATLKDAAELNDEYRQQMLEVAEQAKSAAQQPRPNSPLLQGLFMVLCQTIQTLGSAAPAMAALRAAALPFGIML